MNKNKQVLTIGPNYKTLGGGIVSVLSTYAEYDKDFLFLPTFESENNLRNILKFPLLVLNIIFLLLKNKNISMVHIQGASYISFYRKYTIFLLCKYILRKKVIFHIHGAEFHIFYKKGNAITKKLIKHFIEKTDGIIVLSKFWKDFFSNTFKQDNIFILNNTVPNPETFNKKDENKIDFLFLGEVGKRKGTFELIEAIKNIKKDLNKDINFYIGGNGNIDKLNSKIKEYGLEEFVHYVGWISGEKKIELLKKSHVYVLPSHNEGLPISILEAMSYKMPIISTPVGGIPEVLHDKKNGILVTPGNVKEIEDALKFFIHNSSEIETMGDVSSNIVKNYLPDTVIQDLHKIYDKLDK